MVSGKLFEAGTNYLWRAAILFVRTRPQTAWERVRNALFSEVSCGRHCSLKYSSSHAKMSVKPGIHYTCFRNFVSKIQCHSYRKLVSETNIKENWVSETHVVYVWLKNEIVKWALPVMILNNIFEIQLNKSLWHYDSLAYHHNIDQTPTLTK